MCMRRIVGVMVVVLQACSEQQQLPDSGIDGGIDARPCPEDMPVVGYGPPPNGSVKVGQTATFSFYREEAELNAACVQLTLRQPSGNETTVDHVFKTTLTLDAPGTYRATLALKGQSGADWWRYSRSLFITAVAEPPANPPCAELPRGCHHVGRSDSTFTCDDELFDATGARLAGLDGGEWFAADDTLFAWSDGQLHAMAVNGSTVSPTASVPWHEKPLAWSADRRQLAVWSLDGGARFAVETALTKLGDIVSDVPVEALAVQRDGGMLTFRNDKTRVACNLEGVCEALPHGLALGGLRAASQTSMWIDASYNHHEPMRFDFSIAPDGTWSEQSTEVVPIVSSTRVPRRLLTSTPWGARVPGQQSVDMRFPGAGEGGTSDDLVWLTDGATTLVWCE